MLRTRPLRQEAFSTGSCLSLSVENAVLIACSFGSDAKKNLASETSSGIASGWLVVSADDRTNLTRRRTRSDLERLETLMRKENVVVCALCAALALAAALPVTSGRSLQQLVMPEM